MPVKSKSKLIPVKKIVRSKPSASKSVKSAPAKVSSSKPKTNNSPIYSDSPAFRIKKLYIGLIIVILLVGFLVFKYRGLFVAAVVNGQPISRMEVVKETEKQSGKQVINNLVRNTLIEQEAKKQNVTVTDKEIDDEIKKVESNLSKQGQKIDQVLAAQGLTREDLRKLIRLDKLVGKMVGKDIKITDKEVADYIDKNKESLPQDQSEDQLKTTVAAQLKQQALSAKVQTWLADLQNKAKIQYFVQY
ncbi:MAG TPA: SurA N-terminal domain-containing protein [Candidatus Saccharimonadales bacterium]|nr:SurA N-terminal domain-containing protein [Candidatus Saccharimonadales bacterium]